MPYHSADSCRPVQHITGRGCFALCRLHESRPPPIGEPDLHYSREVLCAGSRGTGTQGLSLRRRHTSAPPYRIPIGETPQLRVVSSPARWVFMLPPEKAPMGRDSICAKSPTPQHAQPNPTGAGLVPVTECVGGRKKAIGDRKRAQSRRGPGACAAQAAPVIDRRREAAGVRLLSQSLRFGVSGPSEPQLSR